MAVTMGVAYAQAFGGTVVSADFQLTGDQRKAVAEFRQRHPTEVMTLLFTDVIGSTEIKQRLGEAAGIELLHRHRTVVRDLLGSFREAEEISTAGDSFFIAFHSPSDAVLFALQLQHALSLVSQATRAPIQVRIGIHLGKVFIEEEPEGALMRDLWGLQVDIASRVTALAGAGQVLLTRAIFDHARTALKGDALADLAPLSWMSHGLYKLKGVEDPFEICEVGEQGQAPLAPPTPSADSSRTSLPGTELVLGWRPAVEQTIPGTQWVLEKKLGEGGFGEVWLARHPKSDSSLVFKFCFRADRLRSLKREMTLFRVLKEILGERPDIARLRHIQFDNAPYYLVLEYTPGGNLGDWIERRGGFCNVPMELRLEIVAQIATALAAAHSVGVIHKDVKPSNVLVDEQSDGSIQVRLTDFGIGQLMDREALERAGITMTGFTETIGAMTELSSRTGTRLYMAPELQAGRPPSIQSDIYSLGVLLYQMLIGDLAEPMTTDWERRVRDPILRDDLRHCLAGSCENRLASATELAKRLRSIPRRRQRLRITRAIQAAAAAFLLMGLLAGIVFLVRTYQLRREGPLRTKANLEQYHSNIALASQRVEELHYKDARQLLHSCPKQFRHWEWGYLLWRCQITSVTLQGTDILLDSLAITSDSRRVVTAGFGRKQDRLSDTHPLAGRSPTYMTAFDRKVTVKVWDADTGAELQSTSLWKPDTATQSQWLLYPESRPPQAGWDAGTSQALFSQTRDPIGLSFSSASSPDGIRTLSGGYNDARIYNRETEEEQVHLVGHNGRIECAAFSPDGNHVVTGALDRTARIWDTQTGRELVRFEGLAGVPFRASFSPDGQRLVIAEGRFFYDKNQGVTRGSDWTERMKNPAERMKNPMLPDSYWTERNTAQAVRIWTWPSLDMVQGKGGPPTFERDGWRLWGDGRNVKIWKVQGDSVTTPSLWQQSFGWDTNADKTRAIVPGGKQVQTTWIEHGTADAKVVELPSRREMVSLKGHTDRINDASFSPDGHRIVTASWDGTAKIWDATTGDEILTLRGHSTRVHCAVFSPDGQRVVTGSEEGTVRVWDADSGRQLLVLEVPGIAIRDVAFSGDGLQLAASGFRLAGSNRGAILIRWAALPWQ